MKTGWDWVVVDAHGHPRHAIDAASQSDAKSLMNNRALWCLGWQVKKREDPELPAIVHHLLAHGPIPGRVIDCF